ncbi:type 1 fimbria pilin [Pseudomonas frederiksbergensis]|uniref:type 1 fimbrial protein n=1 Tax=Pseudomonas frederiksbergensis TaxID=104087 RepID=UPI003D1BB224
MNVKRWWVATGLFFAMVGTCGATPLTTQNVIRFEGSIVEPSCQYLAPGGSVIEMSSCSSASRGNVISVLSARSVAVSDHSEIKAKRIADGGPGGRQYDQRYVLIDQTGKQVMSGNYVVTVSMP